MHFRVHRLKEEDVGNASSAASGSDGMTPLQEAAHAQLPKLARLRTLVLKDFGGAKVTEHFKNRALVWSLNFVNHKCWCHTHSMIYKQQLISNTL